jgi:hypothetical protein
MFKKIGDIILWIWNEKLSVSDPINSIKLPKKSSSVYYPECHMSPPPPSNLDYESYPPPPASASGPHQRG